MGIEAHRATVEQARERLGLNKSARVQHGDWLARGSATGFRSIAALRPAGSES